MYDSRKQPKSLIDEAVNETNVPSDLLGVDPVTTQLFAKYTKLPSSTYSALGSETECDDELNALMAKSWSTTTLSASSSTNTLADMVREQGAYVAEALRPCSQPLTCGAPHEGSHSDRVQSASHYPRASNSNSSVVSRHETQRTLSYGTSLKRFLDEDVGNASWSPYNLRVSHSFALHTTL